MFGALDDDDPHGVLWSVFYLLEGFDDDYLVGLIAALPELSQRAPRWAETAVLRIVNTRGEPRGLHTEFRCARQARARAGAQAHCQHARAHEQESRRPACHAA